MSVPFMLKKSIVDYVQNEPEDAVRRVTGGLVRLTSFKGGYFQSDPVYSQWGAGDKGSRLCFWPNLGGMPGFKCGKMQGTFIYLVQLANELEEDDAWRHCAAVLPLRDSGPGKLGEWKWKYLEMQWVEGLHRHAENADEIREVFNKHLARLSDGRRLKYPVTIKGSIIVPYYDRHGEQVYVEERQVVPGVDGMARSWERWKTPVGKPHGIYPPLTSPGAFCDTVIVTVGAWEADQLREQGGSAYAVPGTRYPVPDDILRELGAQYDRIIFMGPAGKEGTRWATHRVGQCRKLGGIRAEVFEWPAGTPDRYTACSAVLSGAKVGIDASGRPYIVPALSVLESGLQKLDKEAQRERTAYAMIHNLIINSPVLNATTKLVYCSLLMEQGENGAEVRVDHEALSMATNSCEKLTKAAIRQLRDYSLLEERPRRGYYHVVTRREIPQSIIDRLFEARQKWERERRERKQQTGALILDIASATERESEVCV